MIPKVTFLENKHKLLELDSRGKMLEFECVKMTLSEILFVTTVVMKKSKDIC